MIYWDCSEECWSTLDLKPLGFKKSKIVTLNKRYKDALKTLLRRYKDVTLVFL